MEPLLGISLGGAHTPGARPLQFSAKSCGEGKLLTAKDAKGAKSCNIAAESKHVSDIREMDRSTRALRL